MPMKKLKRLKKELGPEDPPGEGCGKPLQYSCLQNPMDRGGWWAAVHRVTQSWTQTTKAA